MPHAGTLVRPPRQHPLGWLHFRQIPLEPFYPVNAVAAADLSVSFSGLPFPGYTKARNVNTNTPHFAGLFIAKNIFLHFPRPSLLIEGSQGMFPLFDVLIKSQGDSSQQFVPLKQPAVGILYAIKRHATATPAASPVAQRRNVLDLTCESWPSYY